MRRLLVPLVLSALASAPADVRESLVAVFRDGAPAKWLPEGDGAVPVFDDGSFVLAVASDEAVESLRAEGRRVAVLDGDPRSKDDYYVLHRVSEAALRRIPPTVEGLLLEGETFVFRAEENDATAAVTAAQEATGHRCDDLVKVFFHPLQPVVRRSPLPGRVERPDLAADPVVRPMVQAIDQTNIVGTVTDLQSYFSRRHNESGGFDAQDYLVARYESIPGLVVTTHDFDASHDNVIAELPGLIHPEKVVVLGGHYDSINRGGPGLRAPGADDDASGSATVLEIARVLAQYPFENTIRFAAWAKEEAGLVGSQAYVVTLPPSGVEVVGMLQLDMVGYVRPGDPRDIFIVTNNTDPDLNDFVVRIFGDYKASGDIEASTGLRTGTLSGGTSDHQSFTSRGYPAAFTFEHVTNYSPFIHTANDEMVQSFIRPDFAREFGRLAAAVVATLAVPFDGLAVAHEPVADATSNSARRTLSAKVIATAGVATVELVYRNSEDGNLHAAAMAPGGGPNEWGVEIPAQPYGSTVEYFVRATDSLGRVETSPAGAPAALHSYGTVFLVPIFSDDFEGGGAGWTHGMVAVQDDWQIGRPNQSGANRNDPLSAFSGQNVYGNDLAPPGFNGDYSNHVNNWLESPPFSTAGRSTVSLRYRRWLTVEDGFYDAARIRVNGTQVWRNAVGSGSSNHLDTAWNLHEIDISGVAANRASNAIRFELMSDSGVTFGGWNVDDVTVVTRGDVASLTPSDSTPGSTDVVRLTVRAPGLAGKRYVLVATEATAPGIPVDANRIAPATKDARFRESRRETAKYAFFRGALDGSGASALPEIRLEASDAGKTFWVTGAVIDRAAAIPPLAVLFAPAKIEVQ